MSKIIEASFTVGIKELNSNLITLSKLTGRLSKTSIIQIRVLPTGIELSLKGMSKKIEVKTNGQADISLPVALFKTYLTNSSDYKTFIFRNGELGCGNSIYSSDKMKVDPVFTTTENVLHNNLSKISILKYWLTNTEKENERLGLTSTIKVAKNHLKTDIQEALLVLNQYNVVYEDLEGLVKKKLDNIA